MTTEELKLILDMVKGVTDSGVTVAVWYVILTGLVPLLKYSIVGFVSYKCLNVLCTKLKIEEK